MLKKVFYAFVFYPLGFAVSYLAMFIYLFLRVFASADTLNPIERLLARMVLLGFGQILEIKGTPPDIKKGNLYLCNHESGLDMFVVVASIKEHFNAPVAGYHFKIPIWCWVARAFGGIPVVKNSRDIIVSAAEARLKQGGAMFFFPEGTRSPDGKMLPFKIGAFVLANKADAQIIPMHIEGAFEHQNKSSWWIMPGKITVTFGMASRYYNYNEKELRDCVHEEISMLGQSKIDEET